MQDEEDDHDDLLAAAAAAVDAQQKEASKAGKKKFGLLGRGSGGGAARALSARPSEEEGHLVSSHTAKVRCALPLTMLYCKPYSSRKTIMRIFSSYVLGGEFQWRFVLPQSGLGRWVRRGSENSQSSSPRSLISPRNKGKCSCSTV